MAEPGLTYIIAQGMQWIKQMGAFFTKKGKKDYAKEVRKDTADRNKPKLVHKLRFLRKKHQEGKDSR